MTITCKYSELRSALQGLTEAGTYQIIITDPQNIVLGSSSIAGTIGNSIKQYTIGHINHNIYIDLSTSDLSKALLYSPSISYSFAECAQLVAVGKLTNISSTPNYSHLFDGCSALTNADISNLVYTDDSVFTDIFKGCTSLTVLTICKAFVNKTQSERNLLHDCTALRQIIVADSIHPALINKDTGINGDIIVTGSSYTKGQAIFANDVAVAGPIVGTGALKRDDQGQLIQVNNKEYSRADTLTNEAKHIDSFIGNATSASELNHDIDIDVQGEITGHLTVKTYEKDGETFVRNVLKTNVNSLNAVGVDNNYKLVTKDYLAQELSKINSAMMLKVDRITDTQYELDGQLYNPQAHVIYLVPKANDLNPDDSDSYDEYIWKVDYELFTESSTSTGVLETVNRPNGQKVTLVTANISNIDTINDVKYFSYDGFSFSIPGNTEHIIDAKTKTYTVTSGNANKIQNVDVINSNNIVFTTEGQITYTAFEENNTVKVKVEQDIIESVNIITSDNSQVMYSITETTENFRPAGTPSWERIGNTDINLSGYLRTSELRNGFNFNGDVSTTRNLTVNGDTTLDNTTIGNIFEVNNDQQKISVSAPLNIQKDDDEHINIEDNIINVFGEASKTTISADNITIGEQTRGASDRTVITKTGISSTNINTKEIKLSNGNMDYTICLDDAGNFNIISESGSPDIAINGKKVAYQSDIDRIILSGGSSGSGDSYIVTDFEEETCEELRTNMGIKSVKIANGITEIPDNAFEGCRGITSIEIPESVTYIGSDAFSDCISLKDINLPDVSVIRSNTFKGCQSLKVVDLPDTITTIKEGAFENSGITSFIFSKNIRSLGANIINDCENLQYIKYKGNENEWEQITKNNNWNGNINANIRCNYITDFSQFNRNTCVTYVELAKNIATIPDNAFNGCSNLSEIIIPDGIVSIGQSAFKGCSNLTLIDIPENITVIEPNTFYNCSKLTSIAIPDGVISIGSNAFSNCSSLVSININNNSNFILEDNVLYDIGKTRIIFGRPTSSSNVFVIPNTVTSIDAIYPSENIDTVSIPYSLKSYLKNIPNIIISDNPTSIENSAFYNYYKLLSITIPESVTSIGSAAFSGCSSLTSITIPEDVTSIGSSAFANCSSLTSITIPEGVTSIGDGAFYNCSNLASITIPEDVTSIGSSTFANCSSLTSITIPDSVTSIREYAFTGCSSLTEITIPDGVSNLYYGTFTNCYNLTTVIMPNITSIYNYYSGYEDEEENNPFYNCYNIYEVKAQYDIIINNNYLKNASIINIVGNISYIGYPAFYNCSKLTSITIPNSVTSIDDYAFAYCISLASITIPDSVTVIGYGVFYNCSSLTSITIPEGVTSIGDEAFYGCSNLTNIYYNGAEEQWNAITKGSDWVPIWTHIPFEEWETYVIEEFPLTNTDFTHKTVTISSNITEIPSEAFKNCSTLTELVVPESVTTIGDNAFQSCSSLTSITIPNSVTSIGNYAFLYCSKLISITIPDSVIFIGDEAFNGCSSLTSITIPNSVTSIGERTFSGCSKLTEITIPNSITSIGSSVFYNCSKLTEITIPNSITSIGSSAFYNCSSLTEIAIPDSVISIGDNAFHNCSKLTEIAIPDSVTSIGSSAFSYCSKLTSIVIPEGVTSIGNYVFSGCSGLISVDINNNPNFILEDNILYDIGKAHIIFGRPTGSSNLLVIPNTVASIDTIYLSENINIVSTPYNVVNVFRAIPNIIISDNPTAIEEYAFYDCINLTSITIPNSVTSIGNYAFYNCSKLTEITIPEGVISIGESVFYYCTKLESITIPESVTTIGGSAFTSCSSLTEITIPEGVTSIGNYTFDSCSNLTSITIPDTVTAIGTYAFGNCNNLISITIPNSVTSIGTYAFYNCDKLTSITIPDSVIFIGDEAFYSCNSLMSIIVSNNNQYFIADSYALYNKDKTNIIYFFNKEVISYNIPNGLTSIKSEMFQNCSNLTSITIPEGVTSIGGSAFYNCSSLTTITIPDSVTFIGSSAFQGCSSLTSITISNSVTSIRSSTFCNCSSLTSITIPNSVTSIEYRAFEGCSSLTSITIPNSVTEVKERVFYGCNNLTSITIPNSVTTIGDSAFDGCTSLTSITIPDSVTTIGTWAFEGCSSLTSITIPNSITSIASNTFRYCTKLAFIIIPISVKSIKNYAFGNCSKLTRIYYRGSQAQWNAINKYSNWNYNCPTISYTYNYTG